MRLLSVLTLLSLLASSAYLTKAPRASAAAPEKVAVARAENVKDQGDSKDWPTFLGPNRNDTSRETGLLKEWKTPPTKLWEAGDLGDGYGTVSIAGGKGYLVGFRGKDEVLIALNLSDGKEAWSRKIGPAQHTDHPGARTTPTVDGGKVYVLSVGGDLVCYDTDGKEQWRKNLPKDLKGQRGGWGYAESPLIDGDKLVCAPGGEAATLVALNKNNGELIWKSQVPGVGSAQYASTIAIEALGKRMYVQFFSHSVDRKSMKDRGLGLVGVSAKDGKFLWNYKNCGNGTANCTAAVDCGEGRVFAASGYGTGGGLVQLSQNGQDIDTKELFFSKDMQNQLGGVVLIDGHLYGSCDGSFLTCIDLKTGMKRWKEGKAGKGEITAADGHLYYRNESNGDMMLIEATPDAYKEKGRFKIPRTGGAQAWAYPVVCDGKLYVRDWHNLYCFDIKAK